MSLSERRVLALNSMSYKHLQDEVYYNDLYDRLTVERCRRMEKGQHEPIEAELHAGKITEEEAKVKKAWAETVTKIMLYFVSGDEYEKKHETIRNWIQRDKAKDEKVETAVEPQGVRCLKCGSQMRMEMKDLNERNGLERVMFFFRCDNGCKKGRAFFDDGKEYIPEPNLCPKCQQPMLSVGEKKNNAVITTHTCPNCQHSYKDTFDLKVEKKKPDPNFEADRQRFCYDEKRGSDYIDFKYKMEHFSKVMEEIKEKEANKELYDAVAKIKKLPFGEVQKLLVSAFEENNYANLQFQPPQMDKVVTVSFTAVDEKTGRSEYDSQHHLKKLINKALEGTNWRLVQSSLNYRLGFLSGGLQGLEREEDLKKLVEKKAKEDKSLKPRSR